MTADAVPVPAEKRQEKPYSYWREVGRRLWRSRSARVGLVIIAVELFIAFIGPLLLVYNPIDYTDPGNVTRQPPCIHILGCSTDKPQHLFGTDSRGRDVFSRVVDATRVSLFIGVITVTFGIVVGTVIGALSGFVGGWIDNVFMRFMDVLLAFPSLLLSIALVAILRALIVGGAISPLFPALFAIGIVAIPIYARIVRATVLQVREQDFVAADRALGASQWRLLFHRILPNSLTPLMVAGTLGVATAILDAAALGFLGLGQQPPFPEWGSMLGQERSSVLNAPHLLIFPGVAIMITVLAFNLVGDGLRDALDPRLYR
jgi:ABC-type dipeptide/oligopeptide/nickel transport system permease subunit